MRKTSRSLGAAFFGALLAGASTLALYAASASAQTFQNAQDVREYNIGAQSLASALAEFARQADMQILFAYEDLRDLPAPAVTGRFTRAEALERLLSGSGYQASFEGEGVVRLNPPPGGRFSDVASDQAEGVVITGTSIRGRAPIGAHLVTLDAEAIEASGRTTPEDLVRTLPQVFGGDIAQHVSFQGGNIGGGSTVNLRGLGADATLPLINGRRLPAVGLRGNFADISSIPVSAIERVEVLPDSASAIYGSDAVGGVVNFIMRRDFDGVAASARYGGVTEGALRETRLALSGGGRFGPLSLFAAFEHFDRTALAMADRAYLADSDLRALGGGNFDLLRTNPATLSVSGLGLYGVPLGQDGTDLRESDLIPGLARTDNANAGLDALPAQTQNMMFAAAALDLGPNLELRADARIAGRDFYVSNGPITSRFVIPASNYYRSVHALFPGRTITADYNFTPDLGPRSEAGDFNLIDVGLSARWSIGETWSVEPLLAYAEFSGGHRINNLLRTDALNAALASSNPSLAFNPFGDGSHTPASVLESFRGYSISDITSRVGSGALKADGVVFNLPAGPVRAAFGADYREEHYEIAGVLFVSGSAPTPRVSTSSGRDVTALFGELAAPLWDNNQGQGLDLSLALRHERYSDFGDTTNPKLGLEWRVAESLSLQASYGQSFRAPNLVDLDPSASINARQVRAINITDPLAPSGVSQIIFIAGANPDLREQTAESWSVGLSYRAPERNGLRFDLNYFDVSFDGRISGITNVAAAMFPSSDYGSLVDRSPDPALVAALIAEATALGTAGGFTAADIDAVIDIRAQNLTRNDVRGFDLGLTYGFELADGEVEFSFNGVWTTDFIRQATPASTARNVVGTIGNPSERRARLGLAWRNQDLSAALFANYTSGAIDNLSTPARGIDAWTTIDLRLSADLGLSDALGSPRLSLSVLNALDEDPPFANNPIGVGYDPANADPLGRFVALELSTRF